MLNDRSYVLETQIKTRVPLKTTLRGSGKSK